MLAIWSLFPLPFLHPACTSESSWFTYCWSLIWRILNIVLLTCETSTTVRLLFSHSDCLTLCDSMDCSMPGFPVLHHLLELAQTHIHWVSDAIQPSHPLSSPSPSALNLPSIRAFSNEPVLLIRWPKYWSFSFSISPSNEHPGLISLRMDGLDLLAVQETLKSLLQHHSSKAAVLWCSAFYMVQLSHPYMILEKPQLWPNGPQLEK